MPHIPALACIKAAITAVLLAFFLSIPASAATEVYSAAAGVPVPVTFNDGWRWTYRARVISELRPGVYADDKLKQQVFAEELGLGAGHDVDSLNKDEIIRDADSLRSALEKSGAKQDASSLGAVIAFFKDDSDGEALEAAMRLHPGSGLDGLGWYLLGCRYEQRGFFPEAAGYLKRVELAKGAGSAKTAALFQLGRMEYLKGHYENAKEQLQVAIKAGSEEARYWLADTLLIKGEFSSAARLFKGLGEQAQADPVTLLSMGDMDVINGDFDAARAIFEKLRSRYAADQFLSSFFTLKEGDAYAAEGRRAEALAIYRKTKEMLDLGEGWAMATLSLADAYAASPSPEDKRKAYDFYRTVSSGDYAGAGDAHLLMARTALDARMYEVALKDAKDFPAGYPSRRIKEEMDGIIGSAVAGWMETLSSEGDYYSEVKLYAEYSPFVPFGSRAVTSLEAGRAYAALDLDSDAVEAFGEAIKLGNDDVVQRAMLALSRVYLDQRDWHSAERLIETFSTRFPKSAHKEEADAVLLKAAFMKGDYERTIALSTGPRDAQGLMIKAEAYSRLGSSKEAIKNYTMATMAMAAAGDKAGLARAYSRIGDERYKLGEFDGALSAYEKSLSCMDKDENGSEKQWTLYRIAQSSSKLGKDSVKGAALRELETTKGDIRGWAEKIFVEESRM